MTNSDQESPERQRPNPRLSVQEKQIVEAFSKTEYSVATTAEISEEIDLSMKQTRRRLKNMAAEDNFVAMRQAGGTNLYWMDREIKEPVTVRYPLLRFVRDRYEVKLMLLGVGFSLLTIIVFVAWTTVAANNINLPIGSQTQIIQAGLMSAFLGGGFLLTSLVIGSIRWIFRSLRDDVSGDNS